MSAGVEVRKSVLSERVSQHSVCKCTAFGAEDSQ